jgi:uncharacterized protein
MTREELESIVKDYMDSFTTMTLACCSEEKPWASAVFYARHEFELFFFSSLESHHSRSFARNPRAAAAIHGDYRGWKDIKGLQMEGGVERVKGVAAKAGATASYLKRYPFAKEFLSDPKGISPTVVTKMTKIGLHVFRPVLIRYVNNEAGFGTRWELSIREGRAIGDPVMA